MWFRMRCHLKIVPNIGEVSFVSAFGPLFEWNVLVFPMASMRSQTPQTSGLYALFHPIPPTSDALPMKYMPILSPLMFVQLSYLTLVLQKERLLLIITKAQVKVTFEAMVNGFTQIYN